VAGRNVFLSQFGLLLTALGMAARRTGQLPPPLASAALASAVPNPLAPIYLVMADVGVADPRRALPRPDHHRHRPALRRPRQLALVTTNLLDIPVIHLGKDHHDR
jgi:hypothetical protein